MVFKNENFQLESQVVRNFAFRRMKTSLFIDLLEKKGIHEIFMELHQEIAMVFHQNYRSFLQDKLNNQDLQTSETHQKGLLIVSFGSECVIKNLRDHITLTVCLNSPKNGMVSIKGVFGSSRKITVDKNFPTVNY